MRFSPALVAVATALFGPTPAPAGGEARRGDRIATTAGYSSTIQLVAGPSTIQDARIDIWLHGDHATVRTRTRATGEKHGATWFGIVSGESEPSSGLPGGLRAGDFPSMLVWRGSIGGEPLDWTAWLAQAPGSGVVTLAPFGFEDAPEGRVHRWPGGSSSINQAIWTVPYAGDTYGAAGALDCSCGDPWSFGIEQAYFVFDPGVASFTGGDKAMVDVTVHNLSGVSIDLWVDGTGPSSSALDAGASLAIVYGPDRATGPLLVSFLDGWTPGAGSHTVDAQGTTTPWPSKIDLWCGAGAGRFTIECQATKGAKTTTRQVEIPRFLRDWIPPTDTWDREPSDRADWFVAGAYRDWVNGDGPATFADWPWFEPTASPGRTILHQDQPLDRIEPDRYRLTASSTLSGSGGRYAVANLSDGKPATAWCEGTEGYGHGVELTVTFDEPTELMGVGLLPGMVRSDWRYEANAVPLAIDLFFDPPGKKPAKDADGDHQWYAAAPASAEIYQEGHWAPVTKFSARKVSRLVLRVSSAREGRFTGDLCISELMLFARAAE